MSTLLRNLFVILTGLLVTGSHLYAGGCERLQLFELSYTAQDIVDDLMSGAWDARLAGAHGIIYFRESGKVDRVVSSVTDQTVVCADWSLEMWQSQAILHLTYPDGRTRKINLTPTCDGYAIQDVQGAIGTMNKIGDGGESHAIRARDQLKGLWRSTAPRKKVRGELLHWEFKSNGEFRLSTSPDFAELIMAGIWDVTPDGEHIILFLTRSGAPESVYDSEVIIVRAMDFEDLVLQSETFGEVFGKRYAEKTMYFEKIPDA